jgi:hypothetical protein
LLNSNKNRIIKAKKTPYELLRKNPEKTISGTRTGELKASAAFEEGAADDKNKPLIR